MARAHQYPRLMLAVVCLALTTVGSASRIPASADEEVSFTDDFERAAGPVGAGWHSLRGAWVIRSGSGTAKRPRRP